MLNVIKVINDRPPNYLKIVAIFPQAANKSTVFAYAPHIYTVGNTTLSKALENHEQVHIRRQQELEGGPEAWWDKYLSDLKFRFDEELIAHIAEYEYMAAYGSREERRAALKIVATRLSSQLYYFGISYKKACKLIVANGKVNI
jgi:hypothetical protein